MKFNVEKTVEYWIDGAEYDIETAESLFQTRRYPYALFFGHLAIEKILKALFVKETRKHAPYTHSLPLLASKLTIEIPERLHKKLAQFMEFYLEARYPEERIKFYKKCTKEFTESKLDEVREAFRWLRRRL